MTLINKILFLFLVLLSAGAFAVDSDGDGSDAVEEVLAETSDSDPTERPYWWRTFHGDNAGDQLGISVSDAGDVNGDTYPDFIFGARLDDNNGTDSGSARVVSGQNGTILYTFSGDSVDDFFGWSVSGAGDVNGDGYADVIVGAFNDVSVGNEGSARIFSGSTGAILYTLRGNDYFGYAVSEAGDVNADGYDDVVIGSLNDDSGSDSLANHGSVKVFSGSTGMILYTFYGDGAGHQFGSTVDSAGDVNNDGYADIVAISSYRYARVFSGANGAILHEFKGPMIIEGGDLLGAFEGIGRSVVGAGDVNGDGYDDIMLQMLKYFPPSLPSIPAENSIWLLSGLNGDLLYEIKDTSDYYGEAISTAGDVDKDGYADVIVGAYQSDKNGDGSGSARVFLIADLINDIDRDFILNSADNDNDNDGVLDVDDAFPLNAAESIDTDTDGIGNNADWDDDNDGVPDSIDVAPLDAGNANEIILPLEGIYKGGALNQSGGAE